jgi:hypothetical protein
VKKVEENIIKAVNAGYPDVAIQALQNVLQSKNVRMEAGGLMAALTRAAASLGISILLLDNVLASVTCSLGMVRWSEDWPGCVQDLHDKLQHPMAHQI